MTNFRLLYVIAAGIGCFYGSSIDGRRMKRFLVDAAGDPVSLSEPDLSRLQRYMKYGLPKRDSILRYNKFEICYDNRTRQPSWVLEHLTKESVESTKEPPKCAKLDYEFHADVRIPFHFQSGKRDYGDRFLTGRLASEGNYRDKPLAMHDTFIYANTSPQDLMFNAGPWEELENYVRKKTSFYDNVYVYTGPLFKPMDGVSMEYQITDHHKVSVPTHFFKIIIGELKDKTLHVGCFVLPNEPLCKDKDLSDFRAELSDIENVTGFILFRDKPFKGSLHEGDQQERKSKRTASKARKTRFDEIPEHMDISGDEIPEHMDISGNEESEPGQSRWDFETLFGLVSDSDDSDKDDFFEQDVSILRERDSDVEDFGDFEDDEEGEFLYEEEFMIGGELRYDPYPDSSTEDEDDEFNIYGSPVKRKTQSGFVTKGLSKMAKAKGLKRRQESQPVESQSAISPLKKSKTKHIIAHVRRMRPQPSCTDTEAMSPRKRELESPSEKQPLKKLKVPSPHVDAPMDT